MSDLIDRAMAVVICGFGIMIGSLGIVLIVEVLK